MKKNRKRIRICAVICALAVMLCSCGSFDYDNRTSVDIEDIDDILLNPDKGWIDYSGFIYNEGYDKIINLGYARYDWSYIEPQKGKFNWQAIDRSINEYASFGKKFAFGVMCANTSSLDSYVTPKWVFDRGAKYDIAHTTSWKDGSDITQYIPNWRDKIFLKNVTDFVKALGERYNGNENIAFIDIRSYGNWGEQHIFEIIKDDHWEYVINNRLTADELKDLYIKPYMEAFPDTLLVNPWGEAIYNDVYRWAIDQGVSLRRDGIFGVSDGTECAMAEGKLPTIFEYTYDYKTLKNKGLWNTDDLLRYMKNGMPSYLQFEKDMYEENKALCDHLANYMGYWIRFKHAEYNTMIKPNAKTNILLTFKNDGIASISKTTYAYLALLDTDGNIVKKILTDIDASQWKPNEEITENIRIKVPEIEKGIYKLAFGLFENKDDENPTYLFGSKGRTEQNWYIFGETKVSY